MHLFGFNPENADKMYNLDEYVVGISTITATGNVQRSIFDVAGNVIDLVNDPVYQEAQTNIRLTGDYSLFKNLEHRYFVSVETDLLTTSNVQVVDGKQSTDRSIAKVYFPTECKVLFESEDGILREDVDMEITTRVGQHAFIKKTAPSLQWTSLQTSYDLRFYRFHLYITYRRFQDDGTYKFTRFHYPIQPEEDWNLSVEFVSKI